MICLISHWQSWDSNPSQVPGRRGGEGHQHRWGCLGWLEWLGWLGPMTTWNAKMDSGDEKEAWLLVLRLTSHKSTRASRNMQLMWQTSTSMNSLVFAQQAPSKKAGELERSFRQPFQGNQLAKSANSAHIWCTMMYTCSGGPWEEWRAGFSAATTSTEVEAPEKNGTPRFTFGTILDPPSFILMINVINERRGVFPNWFLEFAEALLDSPQSTNHTQEFLIFSLVLSSWLCASSGPRKMMRRPLNTLSCGLGIASRKFWDLGISKWKGAKALK
jgi:hypothetical protein